MASKDSIVYQKHIPTIYTSANPASDIHSIEGLAMRDLPPEIPQKIQRIIQKKFTGSLPEFALASGMKHSTVYSVLCRGSRRRLQTIEALATALGTDVDFLSQVLLIEDVDTRKKVLDTLLDGMSLRQWSAQSGVSLTAVVATVNTSDQTQLTNLLKVAKALGMNLREFSEVYSSEAQRLA